MLRLRRNSHATVSKKSVSIEQKRRKEGRTEGRKGIIFARKKGKKEGGREGQQDGRKEEAKA
jgi:flagellar biosynthesis/type III secretory pathway protein FliH